jgi:hypothetical protein
VSLVNNGPHTVRVWLEEEITDDMGNPVRRPSPDSPVTCRGVFVQPIASTRGAFSAMDVEQGQRVDASHKLIGNNLPVGWWSRVEWTFEGVTKTFSVLGGPLFRVNSARTRHLSVTLQEER